MKLKILAMALLYFNMTCKITVGAVQFETVNSVKINQSINSLENTARMVLPRNFKEAKKHGRKENLESRTILDFIKVGDPVTIRLGYGNDLQTDFKGYVSRLSTDIPLTIECEDEMWQLKQTKFTRSFEAVKLSELVEFIAPGYNKDILDDIELKKLQINNASAFEVLELLKNNRNFGLFSYFTDDILHVGFASDLKPSDPHIFNLHRNVRNYSRLEFTRAEDFKLQFKAISNNRDGTKDVVIVGNPGGAVRTLNYIDKTKSQLKTLADKKLQSLVFDGYQGSFSAFGDPRVKAGDSVQINDPDYPKGQREGTYLVQSVTKYFDQTNGFKQDIFPSIKLL